MLLVEKEWQELKNSKLLRKYILISLCFLLFNILIHLYGFLTDYISSGLVLGFWSFESFEIPWARSLYIFNLTSLVFYLPCCLLVNVGTFGQDGKTNSHIYACDVKRESLGSVKIGMRLFIQTSLFILSSFIMSAASNLLFTNELVMIGEIAIELTALDIYLRPLAILPCFLAILSIGMFSEQTGKDRFESMLMIFVWLVIAFMALSMNNLFRNAFMEIVNYIFLAQHEIDLQEFILGEMLLILIAILMFALSIYKYKNKR